MQFTYIFDNVKDWGGLAPRIAFEPKPTVLDQEGLWDVYRSNAVAKLGALHQESQTLIYSLVDRLGPHGAAHRGAGFLRGEVV
jgi:hypothetical protein